MGVYLRKDPHKGACRRKRIPRPKKPSSDVGLPKLGSWGSLPAEMRLAIYEEIVVQDASERETPRDQISFSLPLLASVFREWQYSFEHQTFRRFVLHPSDLSKFSGVVRGAKRIRLNYIRRLWLRLKLSEYTCRSCKTPEDGNTITR